MPGAWTADNGRRSRAYTAGNGPATSDVPPGAAVPAAASAAAAALSPVSHKDAWTSCLSAMLGQPVTAQLTDGAAYTGTLTGVAVDNKELSLVLHFARSLSPDEAAAALGTGPAGGAADTGAGGGTGGTLGARRLSSTPVTTNLLIPGNRLALLAMDATAMAAAAAGGVDGSGASATGGADGAGFATDGGISGRKSAGGGGDRQLTRFDDFGPPAAASVDGELDGSLGGLGSGGGGGGSSGRKWDQFAENERKFGVRTSYDEHDYTTKLDKRRPGFHERELKAQRVAAEIEGRNAANPHVREERGQALQDDGDEESRYSTVLRASGPAASSMAAASSAPPTGAAATLAAPAVSLSAVAPVGDGSALAPRSTAAARSSPLPPRAPAVPASMNGAGGAAGPSGSTVMAPPPSAPPGIVAPAGVGVTAAAGPSGLRPSLPPVATAGPPGLLHTRRPSRENLASSARGSARAPTVLGNTSSVERLNLDTATPKPLDPVADAKFREYKQQRAREAYPRDSTTKGLREFSSSFNTHYRQSADRRSGRSARAPSHLSDVSNDDIPAPADVNSVDDAASLAGSMTSMTVLAGSDVASVTSVGVETEPPPPPPASAVPGGATGPEADGEAGSSTKSPSVVTSTMSSVARAPSGAATCSESVATSASSSDVAAISSVPGDVTVGAPALSAAGASGANAATAQNLKSVPAPLPAAAAAATPATVGGTKVAGETTPTAAATKLPPSKAPPTASKKGLNAAAKEFKFNPSAAAFKPRSTAPPSPATSASGSVAGAAAAAGVPPPVAGVPGTPPRHVGSYAPHPAGGHVRPGHGPQGLCWWWRRRRRWCVWRRGGRAIPCAWLPLWPRGWRIARVSGGRCVCR